MFGFSLFGYESGVRLNLNDLCLLADLRDDLADLRPLWDSRLLVRTHLRFDLA